MKGAALTDMMYGDDEDSDREDEKSSSDAPQPPQSTPDMKWRQSYTHISSEYNIFRLMMKESNTKLSKTDLARLWGTVKRGDYYGELGRRGEGKTFSQAIYDIQVTNAEGRYKVDNKMDLVKNLKKSESYDRLMKYMADDWKGTMGDSAKSDMRAGVYEAEDVGGSSVPPPIVGNEAGKQESKTEETTATMQRTEQSTPQEGSAKPGEFVPGKGFKTPAGGFVRDNALNAGGGTLDTVVGNDAEIGDYIQKGPQTVLTATQTLRPKLPIAGGEDIKPSTAKSIVSDTIFDTFSALPEEQTGHFQAPGSRLNQLNRQNETIRYMEKLSEPRQYNPANDPHSRPWQWSDEFTTPLFQKAFSREVQRHMNEQTARKKYTHDEDMPDRLEEDYTSYPSSKRLRRDTPSLYSTVDMNIESMLPTRQESGVLMNRRRFRDQDRATWRSHL